jgi:hypothetical protein
MNQKENIYRTALVEHLRNWHLSEFHPDVPKEHFRLLGHLGLGLFHCILEERRLGEVDQTNFDEYRLSVTLLGLISRDEMAQEFQSALQFWKSIDEPEGVYDTCFALLKFPSARMAALIEMFSLPVAKPKRGERDFMAAGPLEGDRSMHLEPAERKAFAEFILTADWVPYTAKSRANLIRLARVTLIELSE